MKTVLLAACAVLLVGEAHAISRYTSTSMSCAQAQSVIRNEGAAILRWRSPTSGVQRYDRFVLNDDFCGVDEEATSTSVPTADRKSCPLYNCQMIVPDEYFFKRRLWVPG